MYINDIRLLCSHFDLQYEHLDEDVDNFEVNLKLGHKYEEETKELTVIFGVTSEHERSPFQFKIEYGGKFTIDSTEIEHIERLTQINCPAIIFPYIREHIADLTRRSSLKPLHIGPINFVNLKDSLKNEMNE